MNDPTSSDARKPRKPAPGHTDRPYVDPATGHTPGYPRPYVAYPYVVRRREDLADAGRTVTIERIGKDAPEAYLEWRGQVAAILRVDGLVFRLVAAESQVPGGRDGIEGAARLYADQTATRYLPLTEPADDKPDPEGDPRFTVGLLYDVFAVLKAHGYTATNNNPSALGKSTAAMLRLVEAYEGQS